MVEADVVSVSPCAQPLGIPGPPPGFCWVCLRGPAGVRTNFPEKILSSPRQMRMLRLPQPEIILSSLASISSRSSSLRALYTFCLLSLPVCVCSCYCPSCAHTVAFNGVFERAKIHLYQSFSFLCTTSEPRSSKLPVMILKNSHLWFSFL